MAELKTYGDDTLEYSIENLPPIIQWVTPNSKVLEFGPAMGYMTRYMKENLNCEVTAIELNPHMVKSASKYTIQMIVANLDEDEWYTEIEEKGFDFILFGDVLEHLRYPQEVIKKSLDFLSPKGFVLTSVPNIGHSSIILSLLDGEFDYKDYGLLDNTHIHFFTRKSLMEMMDSAGLFCVEENNNIVYLPGSTEFKKFYINHPWSIFSVSRAKDTSIYQFVNKWERVEERKEYPTFKGYRVSFLKSILLLLDDLNEYLGYKFHFKFKLPSFLRKIIRGKQ